MDEINVSATASAGTTHELKQTKAKPATIGWPSIMNNNNSKKIDDTADIPGLSVERTNQSENKDGREFSKVLNSDNTGVQEKKYKLKDSDLPSEDTLFYNGTLRSRKFNVDDLGWSILNRRNNKWNDKIALIDSTVNNIEVKNDEGEIIAGFKDGKFFVKDKEVSLEKFQRYTQRKGDTLTVNYNPEMTEIERTDSIAALAKKNLNEISELDLTVDLKAAAQKVLEEARPKGKTKQITAEVVNKIKEISERLHCNPHDLMAVINSESGFNPQARNKHSGATGLIQFMPRTAEALGTSTEELADMSALDQLDYVEKYLQTIKKSVFKKDHNLTGAELYALIYLPKNAAKEEIAHHGTAYYRLNSGLDKDKDGIISKSDLAQVIQSKYIDIEIV